MSLPKPTAIACIAPLIAAFLLCLGAFLYPHQLTQPATGSGVPAPSTAAEHSTHVGTGQTGGGHALAGSYLAAFAEEAETGDKQPVNAEYLTALLFTAFFCYILGLLFYGGSWGKNGALMLTKHRLPSLIPHPPREPATPLLSVFRL